MNSLPVGLLILGFGGHARSVADVALSCGIKHFIFIDANARAGENFQGHPVQTQWPRKPFDDWACLPASGDNQKRREQVNEARMAGWSLGRLVAPTSTLGVGAMISDGCFIGQHAHIGPMAQVNEGSIINTGAIVEHESIVGNYTHISVNATVSGRCRIGGMVFIGAGATVIDSLEICSNVVIGAGSVVIRSVTQPGVYAGSPIIPRKRKPIDICSDLK